MERFHLVDDAAVILRSKGNYRQAKVYRRGEHLYGAWGGGYVRLLSHHNTTNPNVAWDDFECEGAATGLNGQPVFKAA